MAPARLLLWVALLVVGSLLVRQVNYHVPKPYMDEIFHVPQAQAYCNGSFTRWDPMITTFPGLYITSAALAYPRGRICSTAFLRGVNTAFSLAQYYLYHAILQHLHPEMQALPLALRSLSLTIFPLQYFYSFIYYTDAGSTAFVLLTYLLALQRRTHLAALAGLGAVLFRQTNIVWVAISLAASLLARVSEQQPRQRDAPHSLLNEISRTLAYVSRNLIEVSQSYWSGALLAIAFVSFILWNGSLVLGDKSHHKAVLHLPQLLYFGVVAAGALHLRLLSVVATLILRPRPLVSLLSIATLIFAFISVRYFSFAHPYLLADNRHYSFYLWRLITRFPPWSPYIAALLYWLSALLISRLSFRASPLLCVLFLFGTAAVLVPSPLLELRYFALPFVLLSLHLMPAPRQSIYIVDIVLNGLLNAITLYVFLLRPFAWPDGQEARFMW